MMRKFPIIACAILLFAAGSSAWAADVIDRIVVTVNAHIILQSDWDDALAYEALTGGKSLQQITDEDRKAALDRLVDQELLRQQIRTASGPSADPQYTPDEQTISARLQDIRKQFPSAKTDQGWHDLLARYNFTEDELKGHIAMQMEILHLVEERLTPTVQVDEKSIEDYYNQSFLPQLRETGAKQPPLAEVAPKIRELLTQQKLNEALKEWLQNLRSSSTIHLQPTTSDGSQS